MSESTNEPRPHGDGFAATEPDGARKKQLMALGSVVGLAIVLGVGYFVFLKGGSAKPAASQPPAQAAAGATRSPNASSQSGGLASPSVGQPGAIPAAYPGPIGHNPFKPLVVTPPPAPPSSASPSPSASPRATASPSVIVIPTPTPSKTPTASPTPTITVTATPSPTGLPTAGSAITLTLVSVDSTAGTADVTVAQGTTTTPYNGLKPGQVFGAYFKLVSILSSDPANPPVKYGADFEYGDQFVQLGTGEWSQFG